MVDLGLFNYIKKEQAEGKSKDEIIAQLQQNHWSPAAISEAFSAVENNQAPKIAKASKVHYPNPLITLFILVLLAGLAYLVFTNSQKIPTFASLFQGAQNPTSGIANTASNVSLYSYTNNTTQVTLNLPTGWQVTNDLAGDGSIDGFTATGNLGIDNNGSIELDQQLTTILLSGVVVNRRSQLSQMPSLDMLKDQDVTIGGQAGHVFEYTYQSGSLTYHKLEGYVVNLKNGDLYTYTATGLDADWSQIPANAVLNSLTFTS